MNLSAKIFALVAALAVASGAVGDTLSVDAVRIRNGGEFALEDIPVDATAELVAGGSIRFLLGENATTGYRWEAEYDAREAAVTLEHRAGRGALAGASGLVSVIVNLTGNDSAPVPITFKYVRPWEKDVPPVKTMRLVLYRVKGGKVISDYPDSRLLAFLKAECANRGIELVDWHMHMRGGLTPELAVQREKKSGIRSSAMENHGREWEICDNARLREFAARARKANPVMPVGIQVNDRDWFEQIDAVTLSRFDYVLADTMIMGKLPNGRDRRLWLVKDASELGDPETWMEEYMRLCLKILDEPISILANPTYLPEPLNALADRLWTESRMRALIAKAVEKGVAIEIQAESPYPRPAFLRLAKKMGAKFSFGTNNYDYAPKDLSRWLEVITWLDLREDDIWKPKQKFSPSVDNLSTTL